MSARPVPDLGSIIELQVARDDAWAELCWWLRVDGAQRPAALLRRHRGWYSASRAYEIAEQRLQSALWYQAVFSHRWVRQDATEGYPDAVWWWMWRRVLSLRWALAGRRSPPSGFNRSREIAVRDPGTVVGSGLFRPE